MLICPYKPRTGAARGKHTLLKGKRQREKEEQKKRRGSLVPEEQHPKLCSDLSTYKVMCV